MEGFIVNVNHERGWGIIAAEGINFRFFRDDLPPEIPFDESQRFRVVKFTPHISDRGRKAQHIQAR